MMVLAGIASITVCPSSATAVGPCREPSIRIYKAEGQLELRCSGLLRRTFPATFGANPVGPKEREGDERTPEGSYRITSKVASARFHRFMGISYPNTEDRARARAKGIRRIGGGIGIHGTRADLAAAARTWTRIASATGLAGVWGPTDGCIGLSNEDVETLYRQVAVGTPVSIHAKR